MSGLDRSNKTAFAFDVILLGPRPAGPDQEINTAAAAYELTAERTGQRVAVALGERHVKSARKARTYPRHGRKVAHGMPAVLDDGEGGHSR